MGQSGLQMEAHEAVMASVREAFEDVPRPAMFIRGTCHCCECQEHDQTLAAHTPDTITMEELGNPGWDPICFASDRAFAYYLPAMVRLALGTEEYVDQLLFHLSQRTLTFLDQKQAKALLDALWLLLDTRGSELAGTGDEALLEDAIRRLSDRV